MLPPSMTDSLPVIEAARSGARKATNSATSVGQAGRLSGMPPSDFSNCSRAAFRSVTEVAANLSIGAAAAVVSVNPGTTGHERTLAGEFGFGGGARLGISTRTPPGRQPLRCMGDRPLWRPSASGCQADCFLATSATWVPWNRAIFSSFSDG